MNTAEALRETKEILIRKGWSKNSSIGNNGSPCLAMAVNMACIPRVNIADEIFALFDRDAVVKERSFGDGPYTCHRTVEFNVHPDTALEDVFSLIERVRNKTTDPLV